MQALYRDTFIRNKLDGIVFPTAPKVAIPATPESSLPPVHSEHRSRQQTPMFPAFKFRSRSKLPVGLELDGLSGSDRRLLAIGVSIEKVFGRLLAPSR